MSAEQIQLVDEVLNSKGDLATLLGIEATSTFPAIKKKYRSLALLLHPDKNPAPDAKKAFQLLKQTFDQAEEYLKLRDQQAKVDTTATFHTGAKPQTKAGEGAPSSPRAAPQGASQTAQPSQPHSHPQPQSQQRSHTTPQGGQAFFFSCPKCGQRLRTFTDYVDLGFNCLACGHAFKMATQEQSPQGGARPKSTFVPQSQSQQHQPQADSDSFDSSSSDFSSEDEGKGGGPAPPPPPPAPHQQAPPLPTETQTAPTEAPTETPPPKRAARNKGPWSCAKCQSMNLGMRRKCSCCGAPQPGAELRRKQRTDTPLPPLPHNDTTPQPQPQQQQPQPTGIRPQFSVGDVAEARRRDGTWSKCRVLEVHEAQQMYLVEGIALEDGEVWNKRLSYSAVRTVPRVYNAGDAVDHRTSATAAWTFGCIIAERDDDAGVYIVRGPKERPGSTPWERGVSQTTSNVTLRPAEAKSQKNVIESVSSNPMPKAKPVKKKTWICTKCSLPNPPKTDKCKMCSASRPERAAADHVNIFGLPDPGPASGPSTRRRSEEKEGNIMPTQLPRDSLDSPRSEGDPDTTEQTQPQTQPPTPPLPQPTRPRQNLGAQPPPPPPPPPEERPEEKEEAATPAPAPTPTPTPTPTPAPAALSEEELEARIEARIRAKVEKEMEMRAAQKEAERAQQRAEEETALAARTEQEREMHKKELSKLREEMETTRQKERGQSETLQEELKRLQTEKKALEEAEEEQQEAKRGEILQMKEELDQQKADFLRQENSLRELRALNTELEDKQANDVRYEESMAELSRVKEELQMKQKEQLKHEATVAELTLLRTELEDKETEKASQQSTLLSVIEAEHDEKRRLQAMIHEHTLQEETLHSQISAITEQNTETVELKTQELQHLQELMLQAEADKKSKEAALNTLHGNIADLEERKRQEAEQFRVEMEAVRRREKMKAVEAKIREEAARRKERENARRLETAVERTRLVADMKVTTDRLRDIRNNEGSVVDSKKGVTILEAALRAKKETEERLSELEDDVKARQAREEALQASLLEAAELAADGRDVADNVEALHALNAELIAKMASTEELLEQEQDCASFFADQLRQQAKDIKELERNPIVQYVSDDAERIAKRLKQVEAQLTEERECAAFFADQLKEQQSVSKNLEKQAKQRDEQLEQERECAEFFADQLKTQQHTAKNLEKQAKQRDEQLAQERECAEFFANEVTAEKQRREDAEQNAATIKEQHQQEQQEQQAQQEQTAEPTPPVEAEPAEKPKKKRIVIIKKKKVKSTGEVVSQEVIIPQQKEQPQHEPQPKEPTQKPPPPTLHAQQSTSLRPQQATTLPNLTDLLPTEGSAVPPPPPPGDAPPVSSYDPNADFDSDTDSATEGYVATPSTTATATPFRRQETQCPFPDSSDEEEGVGASAFLSGLAQRRAETERGAALKHMEGRALFRCPHCDAGFQEDLESIDLPATCPACSSLFLLLSSMVVMTACDTSASVAEHAARAEMNARDLDTTTAHFECPFCSTLLLHKLSEVGKQQTCGNCSNAFMLLTDALVPGTTQGGEATKPPSGPLLDTEEYRTMKGALDTAAGLPGQMNSTALSYEEKKRLVMTEHDRRESLMSYGENTRNTALETALGERPARESAYVDVRDVHEKKEQVLRNAQTNSRSTEVDRILQDELKQVRSAAAMCACGIALKGKCILCTDTKTPPMKPVEAISVQAAALTAERCDCGSAERGKCIFCDD